MYEGYQRSHADVSVYEIRQKDRDITTLRLAVTLVKQEEDRAKL